MTPKHLLITDCSEICAIIFLFFTPYPSPKIKYPCLLIFHSRAAAVYNTPPINQCPLYHTGRVESSGPMNATGENLAIQIKWGETLLSHYTIIHMTADVTGSPETRILLCEKTKLCTTSRSWPSISLIISLLTSLKHVLT